MTVGFRYTRKEDRDRILCPFSVDFLLYAENIVSNFVRGKDGSVNFPLFV